MKWHVLSVIVLGLLAIIVLPAAAQSTCYEDAQQQYNGALDLCKRNKDRINCFGYCGHLGAEQVDEFITVDEMYREEWDKCYREKQLDCEVSRDLAFSQCLEVSLHRFQDHRNRCAMDPESTPAPVMPLHPDVR